MKEPKAIRVHAVVEYLSVFIACCVTDIIKYIEANYNIIMIQ